MSPDTLPSDGMILKVFTPHQLGLEVDWILMGEGADPQVLRQRKPWLVEAAEHALELGLDLLQPQLVMRLLDVDEMRHQQVRFTQGGSLAGEAIGQHLAGARQVALVVYTIGPLLEERIQAEMNTDPTLAFAFEGLANAAVEALGGLVFHQLEEIAAARNWQLSILLSPGMVGWSLEEGQPQIFRLLDTSPAGVEVTSAWMMLPRKTSSAVVGLGPDLLPAEGLPCEYCTLNGRCRYKEFHGRAN